MAELQLSPRVHYESTGHSRMIAGSNIYGNINISNVDVPPEQADNSEWVRTINWLVPSKDSRSLQAIIRTEAVESYLDGTCQWFLSSDRIDRLASGREGPIWLHGVGKWVGILQ